MIQDRIANRKKHQRGCDRFDRLNEELSNDIEID
jgi:hypothetical protein